MRYKILKLLQVFLFIVGGLMITYGSVGAITKIMVPRGGTGAGIFQSGAILIGSGINPISTTSDIIIYNNKIGIGTTTPARPLHVVGDGVTQDTGCVRFGISANEYTEIGHRGNNSSINAVGDGLLCFRHDGTNKMTLSDIGDVVVAGDFSAVNLSGDGSNITNVGVAAASALTISGKAAENIAKGQAVYVSGATGQNVQFLLADNTVDAKTDAIGLAASTQTSGQTILIRLYGQLTNFDTSAWTDGDKLYLSTSGNLASTTPTSGTILHIADVEYSHASLGDVVIHTRRTRNKGAPADTNIFTRLGDSAGVNEIEYRDYANNEVANIDSDGNAFFGGNIISSSLTLTGTLSLGTGTTTASNGFDILAGCYAINGACLEIGGAGEGTVTSVAMSVPTGLTVGGSPITDSGTLAVTLTGGYIIPKTASTTEWHTAQGYVNQSVLINSSPTFTTPTISGMVWDGVTLATSSDILNLWNIYSSNGNIGIGSTTPTAALSIFQGDVEQDLIYVDSDSSFEIDVINLKIQGVQKFRVDSDGRLYGNEMGIFFDSDNYWYGNVESDETSMSVLGHVGIGSTTPFKKLSVTGGMYIDGVDTATSTIEGNFEYCNNARTHCCYTIFGSASSTKICY